MSQHDHEHMPDQQPKGADEQSNMDVTAAHPESTHDQDVQPSSAPLAYRPTPAQIAAVSFLSVLALTAALIFSASYANLRLSARDVGGAIMPPGMIMTYDTPGQSMRDMAAVDPRTVSYIAPADARGDQPLEPRVENGVKVFDLDVSVIKWNILPLTAQIQKDTVNVGPGGASGASNSSRESGCG